MVLKKKLDELHLNCPIAGARMLRLLMRRAEAYVGRWQVATLLRFIGITMIAPRRASTSVRIRHWPTQCARFVFSAVIGWTSRRVPCWYTAVMM
ncbi:MAG TPA: hypothetical protein VIJ16_01265 [Gemmatimonadaceae bacterium]